MDTYIYMGTATVCISVAAINETEARKAMSRMIYEMDTAECIPAQYRAHVGISATAETLELTETYSDDA